MKLLTLQEVSDRTALSRRTLYRMIKQGDISIEHTFMVGLRRQKRVITEEWVDKFLKSHNV